MTALSAGGHDAHHTESSGQLHSSFLSLFLLFHGDKPATILCCSNIDWRGSNSVQPCILSA